MDFPSLMVRMLSVDTLLFHTDLLPQAGEILWLTVAVLAILCRLVSRVTTRRQQPLRVRDTLHIMMVAALDRSRTLCACYRCSRCVMSFGRWGLEAVNASERVAYFEFPGFYLINRVRTFVFVSWSAGCHRELGATGGRA